MERIQKNIRVIPPFCWIIASWCWMIVIFIFSGRQSISVSEQYWTNFIFFKLLHVTEYAILTFFNIRAFTQNLPQLSYRKSLTYAAFGTLLFALSDEIHQTFVPTREGLVRDVLIDAIGISSVYWVALRYERTQKNTP